MISSHSAVLFHQLFILLLVLKVTWISCAVIGTNSILHAVMLHYDSDDCSDIGTVVSSMFLTDDPIWPAVKHKKCVKGSRILGYYKSVDEANEEIAGLYNDKFLTVRFDVNDIELNYPMGECLAWSNELPGRSMKFELWNGDIVLVSMYKNEQCKGLPSYLDEKHLMPDNIKCAGFEDQSYRTVIPNGCLAPLFANAWGHGDETIEEIYQHF